MAKLPNAERAQIDIRKLTGYSLDESHRRGRHKARVFRSALGITAADAEWLAHRILEGVRDAQVADERVGEFGRHYVVDLVVEGPLATRVVRTCWIIEHGASAPRLTSCYVR